jgi:DNA-binding CsgD family transcriptional regulator
MPEYDSTARRTTQERHSSLEFAATHVEMLEAAAERAGFQHFLMARFPRGDSVAFAENRIASNWPPIVADLYAGSDVFHCSQLVAALKSTNMPVFCDGGAFASAAANHRGDELAKAFAGSGMRATFAFTLHDAALRHYIFAFSGDRPALSDGESMELIYASMQVIEAFVRENGDDDQPAERLSKREIECLRWSAAGKSSEEIAIILQLSSHTVASYLKSAMRKLDSVNRMQAVARAFRYRLL